MSKTFINDGLELYENNKTKSNVTDLILKHANDTYERLSTRSSALGKLKRMIINKYYSDVDVPAAVAKMVLPTADYAKLMTDGVAKLSIKENTEIKNTDEFMNNILMGIVTSEPAKLFTALALACGRRSVELNELGSFKKTKSKNKYEIEFTGQVKSPNTDSYIIPLLVPAGVFVDAFDRWRAIIRNNSANALSAQLGRFVKAVTKRNMKPHTLRGLYANICYEIIRPNTSINNYLSMILGHESPSSSVYYTSIRLNGLTGRWRPKISMSDFKPDYNAAERVVVENIINLYNDRKPITTNALRTMRSSHAVITRVMVYDGILIKLLKSV